MKSINVFKKSLNHFSVVIISLSIILCIYSLQSCTSKKEKERQREEEFQNIEEGKQKVEKAKEIKFNHKQDSIAKTKLILKYNPFIKIHTLDYTYTFRLRELIESHSNLVGFEGEILDIDKLNGKNIITLDIWPVGSLGIFYCDSLTCQGIIQETGDSKDINYGYFIVHISDFKPTYLSAIVEDDSEHIDIESNSSPPHLFHGEIIDFYIEK